MAKSQLNLNALRRSAALDIKASESGPPSAPTDSLRKGFTRREWLGLMGGGLAGLGLLAGRPRSDLKLALLDRRAEIRLGRKLLWAIDCDQFDGSPALTGEQGDGCILLALKNALYPGTSIPADLRCRLDKHAAGWRMLLDLDFPGVSLREDFMRWVTNQSAASQKCRTALDVSFHRVADLRLGGRASVTFFPQFFYQFAGGAIASLRVSGTVVESDGLAFGLGAVRVPTLLRERLVRRTVFSVARGEHSWLVPPALRSKVPWILDAKENGFSQISIETGTRRSGQTASALMAESAVDQAVYSFQPAPGCGSNPENQPFSLDVANVRYAVTAGPEGEEAAIFGSLIGAETWEHPSGARLLLGAGGAESGPSFELVEQPGDAAQLKAEPVLMSVDMPLGSGSCSRIEFEQPPKFACCLGGTSWWRRLLYFLNLSRPEDKLVLPLKDALLTVTRPQDLLSLKFRFKGLALRCEKHKGKLIPAPEGGERLILVEFPPQHVAEQAFFKTNDTSNFKNPNPHDPDASNRSIETPLPPGAVRSRLSGRSTLVFKIPQEEIDYLLTNLLDWTQWEQVVSPAATVAGQRAASQTAPSAERIAGNVTKIELPYRLYLSPHQRAGWINPTALPADADEAPIELWQTRLGVRRQRQPMLAAPPTQRDEGDAGEARYEIDERTIADNTVRAIWSEDYDADNPSPFEGANSKPFRNSLERRDRYEIVELSSNFDLCSRADISLPYEVNPVDVKQLTLSSMGAWLKSTGNWDPPSNKNGKPLVVEEWQHRAQMGRDSFVQVMYKGYLFPFGHKASLVKVTERLFENLPDGTIGAYLRQTLHIIVREPEGTKFYKDVSGQPHDGRAWPFNAVRIMTDDSTPVALDDPSKGPPDDAIFKLGRGQQLFWPRVGGKDYLFKYKLLTLENRWIDSASPLIFLDVSVAFGECEAPKPQDCKPGNTPGCKPGGQVVGQPAEATPRPAPPAAAVDKQLLKEVIKRYNDKVEESRRNLDMKGQKIAYAPSTKEGGTSYETSVLTLRADDHDGSIPVCTDCNRPKQSLREIDQPPFYPHAERAAAKIPGVSELTGGAGVTTFEYFKTYLDKGFDPAANKGEVFLRFDQAVPLEFGGGGPQAGSDKVGGVATPSTRLVGVSRSVGPVGAKAESAAGPNAQQLVAAAGNESLNDISQGNFDPSKYFGDAKILGGIKLSDIVKHVVGELLDETAAPQMIREVEHALNQAEPALNAAADQLIAYIERLPVGARRASNPEADELIARAKEFRDASGIANKLPVLPAVRTALMRFIAKLNDLIRNPVKLLRAFFPDWVTQIERLWQTINSIRTGEVQKEVKALVEKQLKQIVGQVNDSLSKLAGELFKEVREEVRREMDGVQQELYAKLGELVAAVVKLVPFDQLLLLAVEAMELLDVARKRLREFQEMAAAIQDNFDALRRSLDTLLALVELPPAAHRERIRVLVIELCVEVPEVTLPAERVREALRLLEDAQTKGLKLIRAQIDLVENARRLVDSLKELIAPPSGDTSLLRVTPAGVRGPLDAANDLIALLQQVGKDYSWIRNALQDASLDGVLTLIVPPPIQDKVKTLTATLYELKKEIDGYREELKKLDDYERLKLGMEMLKRLEVFALHGEKVLAVMKLAKPERDQLIQVGQSLNNLLTDLKDRYVTTITAPLLAAVTRALDALPPPLQSTFGAVLLKLKGVLTDLPKKSPDETVQALKETFALIRDLPEQLADQVQNLLAQLGEFVRSEELLKEVLAQFGVPSFITLRYKWTPVIEGNELLIDHGGKKDERASLVIESMYKQNLIGGRGPEVTITGELANFKLVLLPILPCITIDFDSVSFSSKNGSKPESKVKINAVVFGEALAWVAELQKALNPSEGPYIIIRANGIEAGFRFAVPVITFGAFNLIMLRIGVALDLPFTGDPVSLRFNLSDRARPFMLSYGIFGGGGFLGLAINAKQHITIDGALEFGLVGAISIGFASGVGYVTAGIYFKFSHPNAEICGFNRVSGEVDILGLITICLDVYISLCYRPSDGSVYGWAEITIKIKYFFFKLKVRLRAERRFAGGSPSSARSLVGALASDDAPPSQGAPCCPPRPMIWKSYREAFA